MSSKAHSALADASEEVGLGLKQFTRSKVVLGGSNKDARSDVVGSQICYYGNDGPASYPNKVPASEIFLAQQNDLETLKVEIEAQVIKEQTDKLRTQILRQVKREQAHGAKLDAEELGRKEFERRKAVLRKQIEAELKPKIERELREMIEKEIREEIDAEWAEGTR